MKSRVNVNGYAQSRLLRWWCRNCVCTGVDVGRECCNWSAQQDSSHCSQLRALGIRTERWWQYSGGPTGCTVCYTIRNCSKSAMITCGYNVCNFVAKIAERIASCKNIKHSKVGGTTFKAWLTWNWKCSWWWYNGKRHSSPKERRSWTWNSNQNVLWLMGKLYSPHSADGKTVSENTDPKIPWPLHNTDME